MPITRHFLPDGTVVQSGEADPTAPITLESADWQEYAYGILGALSAPNGTDAEKLIAGITRYGEIILAASTSETPIVFAAWEQYRRATNFHKDRVELFLQILSPAIVTADEYAAIIASWPET